MRFFALFYLNKSFLTRLIKKDIMKKNYKEGHVSKSSHKFYRNIICFSLVAKEWLASVFAVSDRFVTR